MTNREKFLANREVTIKEASSLGLIQESIEREYADVQTSTGWFTLYTCNKDIEITNFGKFYSINIELPVGELKQLSSIIDFLKEKK